MTDHNLTFAVETITPKTAEQYLKQNTMNRRCSPVTVRRYARAIQKGEWRVNGEAIKFNGNGELLDGQHRLRAIVQAKMPADMCVIRGIDATAFKTMDAGKGRNGADCLYVLQYKHPNALAAAGRMLFAYERHWAGAVKSFRSVSNDELIDTIKKHPGLVEAAHTYMLRPMFTTLIPHSVGMFCFYLAGQVTQARARSFFLELSTGRYSDESPTHPPRVLRERLQQTLAEVLKPSSITRLAWTVQAWNAYYSRRPLLRLSRLVDNVPRLAPDPIKKVKSS